MTDEKTAKLQEAEVTVAWNFNRQAMTGK